MSDPWLTIVGLGEDGPEGLSKASRDALDVAQIIFGGPRHLALVGAQDRGEAWPVPFDIAPVMAHRGRGYPVVVLASGDPFWYGAGAVLAQQLMQGEWRSFGVPGVMSLAATRMGWRLEDTVCLGLHAQPFAHLHLHLARGCQIICTLRDGAAVGQLAQWLTAQGCGAMSIWCLEALGGPRERLRHTRADSYDLCDVSAPVAVALDGASLARDCGMSRGAGLPDDFFAHDGQITRAPVRALTLAALAPRSNALLWDIGGGSGSVSVEWCRAGGRAITIEPRADRLCNIKENIDRFALSGRMQPVHGAAPECLAGLSPPDAVFVGGGGSAQLFTQLMQLPAGVRVVANAVTLDSEARLMALYGVHGGTLLRCDLAQAAPLGRMRGWVPGRPIVQWAVTL
ncbi:precorrin-6y C5,15-methyltransferase (decarboxylating) subunit CbiE [Thioclava sp. SK-1]|uniref:precorrin-6y C5,15-methyltransferase (decarboxylating) subunit CbiE n=1 Tax=Thioclava sp. SK-1 TaxID=1889770 RepID=UPI00082465EC|nr:precorrin-6y C5,15-methyltransferase (decarboxylating) subunit CbiE [Thioclava sp. SK-1]OCX65991.1 precorrin-6y C5,15-methyltransferase (decarboxylating) subunit CbiE [Thioclava sp. SK-1]